MTKIVLDYISFLCYNLNIQDILKLLVQMIREDGTYVDKNEEAF